jgi:hypothetical protein
MSNLLTIPIDAKGAHLRCSGGVAPEPAIVDELNIFLKTIQQKSRSTFVTRLRRPYSANLELFSGGFEEIAC